MCSRDILREEKIMYRRGLSFLFTLVGGLVLGVGLMSGNYIAATAGAVIGLVGYAYLLAQKTKEHPRG